MISTPLSDVARRTLKAMTPPVLWSLVSKTRAIRRRHSIHFSGDYTSWSEALSASGSYANPAIRDHVINAARKVRNGEAAFERDGVAFTRLEYNFPLLLALLRAGVRYGRINVVDFGGSLGSSYFQSHALLGGLLPISWAVVEQANFVEVGRCEFKNTELSFHETIEEACALVGSEVLLLSGVLHYLPDPVGFLNAALAHGFRSVIIDRTPFISDDRTRLTVQHVQIYPASYPAWFFNESLLKHLTPQYNLIANWPALDSVQPEDGSALWKGFLYERMDERAMPKMRLSSNGAELGLASRMREN